MIEVSAASYKRFFVLIARNLCLAGSQILSQVLVRQERDLIDPADAQTMYAADWFSGVYRSADCGQSWIHINEGLRTRAVHRLAISSDGRILYAGKQGEGVFPLVMGARTPLLHNVYPDTGQVVRVAQGEQALFSVSASDLNGDEITCSWLLNDVSLGDRADFSLMTDSLSVGDYQLLLSEPDEVSIVSARWQVSLPPPAWQAIPTETGT